MRLGAPELAFPTVVRPELRLRFDAVANSLDGRVLLICAPAGSGKTVALSEWAEHLADTRPATRVCWLTLAETTARAEDLRAALRTAFGLAPVGSGHPVNGLLDPAELPVEPTVLIVDDAHLVTDPLALAGLEQLLNDLPSTMTVVVSGRFEPPLRWHGLDLSGRLQRVSQHELALSAEQVRDLCAQHDCLLDNGEVETVLRLTHGWAALVRIAAIYLAAQRDRAAGLAVLGRPVRAVSDFLVGELMTALDPQTREFLARTAIPDSFTEDLADQLTGRSARDALGELERINFPVAHESDGEELWFRYHPMLRAYLRAEARGLGGDTMADLHLRTAQWYVAHGRSGKALPHLLELSDRLQLSAFLREQALGLILDGGGGQLFGALDRALPDLASDAYVRLLRIVDALVRDDLSAATTYLELLPGDITEADSFVPRVWLQVLSAAVSVDAALASGLPVGAIATSETLAVTGNPDIDCYAAVQLSLLMVVRGDIAGGERHLRRGLALAAHTRHSRLAVRSMIRLAVAAGAEGGVASMRERATRALDIANDYGLADTPDLAQVVAMTGLAAYLQGDEPARRHFADDLVERIRSGELAPGGHSHVVALLIAFDDADNRHAAAQSLRHSMSVLLERSDPVLSRGLLAPVVWALLRIPDPRPTEQLVEHAHKVLGDDPSVLLCQAALAAAAHKPRSVRALLDPLTEIDTYPVAVTTICLLHAQAHAALGNSLKAYESVDNALRVAAPDHLVRPFLDVPDALDLLDNYAGRFAHHNGFADRVRHHPAARRTTAAPALTETELTVLKQLPSGRTAQQIADDLGVSVNTVKTHLRGIYTKLDTNSRMAALEQARRHGLL
ncbi:LuxR C-terminal-related transcriptional regulator [Nocardia sp. NPDC050406]|uniref:helix-turn-helix transcriptional regulator n=1 Tax=Nocardia sp. NPDC050406 TaxID=3364318 RepID=UPI0037B9674B